VTLTKGQAVAVAVLVTAAIAYIVLHPRARRAVFQPAQRSPDLRDAGAVAVPPVFKPAAPSVPGRVPITIAGVDGKSV